MIRYSSLPVAEIVGNLLSTHTLLSCSQNFGNFNIYLFIFILTAPDLSCSMRDLVPQPEIELGPLALGTWKNQSISFTTTLDTRRNWLSLVTLVHTYSIISGESPHAVFEKQIWLHCICKRSGKELEHLSDLTNC